MSSINEKRASKLLKIETSISQDIQIEEGNGVDETKINERANEKEKTYENEVDGCWAQLSTANKILYATTASCCAFLLILVLYSIFVQG